MTNYKKLKEKQDADFDKTFWKNKNELKIFCFNMFGYKKHRQAYIEDITDFIDNIRKETIEYERKRIKKEFIKWFNSKETAEDIEDAINRILT